MTKLKESSTGVGSSREDELLLQLLRAYGEGEGFQAPESAATDIQLKSLALHFEEWIRGRQEGTVLDIGCGGGVLLERLSMLPAFQDNRRWFYLGVDIPIRRDELMQLGLKLSLQRRIDFLDLNTFNSTWTVSAEVPPPYLIVVRNVLHEIAIAPTAQLLHTIHQRTTDDDVLFIQDLLVFPRAERGNVCWDTTCLKRVLAALGFDVLILAEPSRSGAQWFSAKIVRRPGMGILQPTEVFDEVVAARLEQLNRWREVDGIPLPHADSRPGKLALIDFDLQRAALFEQLVDANVLVSTQRDTTTTASAADAFTLAVSACKPALIGVGNLHTIQNFRDRAKSQDSLEAFLASDAQVVVVKGGALCGKTTLVAHVLKRRAHGRTPIVLDCTNAQSVWPLVENYLLGLGCASSFEVLRGLHNIRFSDIKDGLAELITSVASRTIIVFDHFETLLDPVGRINGSEVRSFLQILVAEDDSKLILTTRHEPVLDFFLAKVQFGPIQPYVGRFPEGSHTENLLDDYVDRPGLGIVEYPKELLDAVDRYPYLATLAGKLIAKNGGSALHDPEVVQIIKLLMYDDIVAGIVTPPARKALDIAAILRVPTPRFIFEQMVGRNETLAAEQTGFLYLVYDAHRNDLLDCAGIIRHRLIGAKSEDDQETENEKDRKVHADIAYLYSMLARSDDADPRWVREAHYHTLASGDVRELHRFGRLYGGELLWAGQTWFRRFRDYQAALEALMAAEELGVTTYDSRRIVAACLIRTGQRPEGVKRYEELIAEFPDFDGPKTSYVDSILSMGEYAEALDLLKRLALSSDGFNPWVAGQYGRAFMGLHRYREAVTSFERQRRISSRPEAIVYVRLAQCYYRLGERGSATSTLEEGRRLYLRHPALSTLYAANLIHEATEEALAEAESILNDVLSRCQHNAFALLKLIKVYELTGRGQTVQGRLSAIGWKVEPAGLIGAVRVAASIAAGNFTQALRQLSDVDAPEEYREALFRRVYLSWLRVESDEAVRSNLARTAIERPLPRHLQNNVPLLTMQAQLASIAGDELLVERYIELVRNVNPNVAARLFESMEQLQFWDDVEALM